MKFLTKTDNNGWVVELSQEEMREIRLLICAVEGKTIDEAGFDYSGSTQKFYQETHPDTASAFGAIRAFYNAQFRVNEIEKALKYLKGAVFPERLKNEAQ